MSSVDYLLKDAIIPDNQNYCCVSLFMNEDKTEIKYIKVSGGFKTVEDLNNVPGFGDKTMVNLKMY